MSKSIIIRKALYGDLNAVIALEGSGSSKPKPDYWQGVFNRYVDAERDDSLFLVAERGGVVVGYIVGEVRAWEFGSPPCGWVFALGVSPNVREEGIGQKMFEEICLRLKRAGVSTVKTMVNLENRLTLSFFRSQGLRSGRFVELEKQLD